MKTALAVLLLVLVSTSYAEAAVACGPRGCVAARPHYYGRPGYDRGYGYHRPGYGCAWVAGVRVCR